MQKNIQTQDLSKLMEDILNKDLDFFLTESTEKSINEDIYRILLVIRSVDKREINVEGVFQMAYLYLYGVKADKHPEMLLEDEYIPNLNRWDNSTDGYLTMLVLLTIRTLLQVRPELDIKEERFLEQLRVVTNPFGSYSSAFDEISTTYKNRCDGSKSPMSQIDKLNEENRKLKEENKTLQDIVEEGNLQRHGTLRVKFLVLKQLLRLSGAQIADVSWTKFANLASYMFNVSNGRAENMIYGPDLLGDYHEKEIKQVEKMLDDLGLKVSLQQ